MARPAEDPALVVRDLREPPRAHLAEGDLRFEGVEDREAGHGVPELVGLRQDLPAELGEQPLDLAPLLGGGQGQVVVGLDDFHRLDEDRLARARTVVHDPRHAAARRGLDGQAIPVVPQHDESVAEGLAPIVEELLEQSRHFPAPPPQSGADRRKLRRGVVLEAAVLAEELRGALKQRLEGRQPLAVGREDRAIRPGERAADGVAGAGRADDRPELFGRAAPARALEGLEDGIDVVEAGEGEPPVPDLEDRSLRRLGEALGHVGRLESGGQRQNRRPTGRRAGEGRNEPEDDAELERIVVGAAPVSRGYNVARRSSDSLRSIFLRA